jgi:hypothetical protein
VTSLRCAFLLSGTLAAAQTLGACSCGDTHEPPFDASRADGDASQPVDAAADTPDDGVCRIHPGLCVTDADCSEWAAAVGPAGTTVSTMCPPGGGYCTLGVFNCSMHDGTTTCFCASAPPSQGLGCVGGEICVADTPGGPTRCARQCEGR